MERANDVTRSFLDYAYRYVHHKETVEAFHYLTVDTILQFQLCVNENSEEIKVNSIRLQYSLYYIVVRDMRIYGFP